MNREKWCEHLESGESGYRYQGISNQDGKRFGYFLNTDKWTQCPECQVPRPEEKRELAEVLYDAWWSKQVDKEEMRAKFGFEREAKAAIAWFLELIERNSENFRTFPTGEWIRKEDLKSALLKEEA